MAPRLRRHVLSAGLARLTTCAAPLVALFFFVFLRRSAKVPAKAKGKAGKGAAKPKGKGQAKPKASKANWAVAN